MQAFCSHIETHAYATPQAIAVQVHFGTAIAVGAQLHGVKGIRHRQLGNKVHQAPRRRHARLHAGHAFQDFNALFVFQCQRGVTGNSQAVAAVVAAGVQQKTAHRHILDIARGVVAVGQGRIQLDGLRQGGGTGRQQDIGTQHRHALWCFKPGQA